MGPRDHSNLAVLHDTEDDRVWTGDDRSAEATARVRGSWMVCAGDRVALLRHGDDDTGATVSERRLPDACGRAAVRSGRLHSVAIVDGGTPDRREPYPPGRMIVWPDDEALVEVRRDWAEAADRVRAMKGPDELLAALREPDGRVRRWAARRLATEAPSDPRTIPALIDALGTDPAWQVREGIAQYLGDFDAGSAQAAFREACSDEDDDVRDAAAEVLRRRASPTPP
jgi:hypothetical protein